MSASPYPHLSPELRALSGDALRLWGDADERRRALEAIVTAWDTGSPELRDAIERVDRAVAVGLRALGFPRGETKGVRLEASPVRWAGRKDPDCTLNPSVTSMRFFIEQRLADAIVRTWVHESLHGRQAYTVHFRREYGPFPGYEEGAAEGLARIVTRDKAGMSFGRGSLEYYVAAYRTLATVLGLDAEQLWRSLWQHPPGELRAAFPRVVDALYRGRTGSRLGPNQLANLRGLADLVFREDRSTQVPSPTELMATWRVVLR